ncbi:MAG: hypothetical protein Q9226_006373 [Calogaya cf. arnoldii]
MVITDFALLFLPVPLLWKLQATTKKKLGLAVVFATGSCASSKQSKVKRKAADHSTLASICTVSIVRQSILYNTNKVGDNYHTKKVMVWMDLEFSFSVIVATLPVLTPLFKRLSILSTWLPTLRSKITRSKRSSPSTSKHSKTSGPDQDQDIERNALRGDHYPLGSWQAPSAWEKSGYSNNGRR